MRHALRATPPLRAGRALWALAAALLLTALSGCAGGGAAELTARPRPQPLTAAAVSVPRDGKLSIALSSFSKRPGLEGQVSGDATADARGGGELALRVQGGGAAEATLQLGHAFSNETDRQVELDLSVRFALTLSTTLDPAAVEGDATMNARLFVRDGANRLLRAIDVTGFAATQGSLKRSARDSQQLTLTLGPGQSAQVFLGIDAAADTLRSDRSASLTVTISDFAIDATTRPAPGAAGDGR
ncbi:MAG: hypothetical protein IPM64_15680 [Phycisphaerales bacterium]|nr:hypothetical protein [Phycisphaerales bacterium]